MIIAIRYLILLMALIIAGCSGEDTFAPKPGAGTPAVSQEIASTKVTITPDNATSESVFTLNADASLLSNAIIDWYINGEIKGAVGITRFSSSDIIKGDIIKAVVTKNSKEYFSNEISILNTPPRINRAEMFPALPKTGDPLSVEVNAQDVDGDTIYYTYKWTLNGKQLSDENYLRTELKRDDMIVVEIIPYDSDDTGSKIFVKNKVFNSPPIVSENNPSLDGKTYTYQLKATDPDGDVLTYKVVEGPEDMSIDPSGLITWLVDPKNIGRNEFKVSVNDNNGGELIVPITARIRFE